MGLFTDGEDDEVFDLFILNEISGTDTGHNSKNTHGGCLTCFVIMLIIPMAVTVAVTSLLF